MKEVKVVAAVIQDEGKILCVQRGANKHAYISYKYEFPGGKIEEGESRESALRREINEELNLDIIVGDELITIEHTYPDFRIVMYCFMCTIGSGDLVLKEHVDYKWLDKKHLESLDWAEADLPAVEKIQRI